MKRRFIFSWITDLHLTFDNIFGIMIQKRKCDSNKKDLWIKCDTYGHNPKLYQDLLRRKSDVMKTQVSHCSRRNSKIYSDQSQKTNYN